MKNYINDGKQINYTADADIASGAVVVVGDLCCVATKDIADGATGALLLEGVVTLAKAAGTYTQGDTLYWDDTAKNATTDDDTGANPKLGYVYEGSAGTTVKVKLAHA